MGGCSSCGVRYACRAIGLGCTCLFPSTSGRQWLGRAAARGRAFWWCWWWLGCVTPCCRACWRWWWLGRAGQRAFCQRFSRRPLRGAACAVHVGDPRAAAAALLGLVNPHSRTASTLR